MSTTVHMPEAPSSEGDVLNSGRVTNNQEKNLTKYEASLALGELVGRRVTDHTRVERRRIVPRCAPETSQEPIGTAFIVNVTFHDNPSEQPVLDEMTVWENRPTASPELLDYLRVTAIAGPLWDRIEL